MRLADLPDLPAGGLYRGVVLHWSAGPYLAWFDHYNLCVLGPPRDGDVVLSLPIAANLRRIRPGDGLAYGAHARGRNSGRVGIGAMCMYRGTMSDYGAFPPTPRQVETMCALAGLVAAKYGTGLPVNAQVRTHYQWAVEDGYYPDRWDWMREGPALVRKVAWYAASAR